MSRLGEGGQAPRLGRGSGIRQSRDWEENEPDPGANQTPSRGRGTATGRPGECAFTTASWKRSVRDDRGALAELLEGDLLLCKGVDVRLADVDREKCARAGRSRAGG